MLIVRTLIGMRAVLTLLLLSLAIADYKLRLHPLETGARCVDGSPAGVYVSEGDNSKVLIFFQEGGMCGGKSLSDTLANCYERAGTDWGSSLNYPPTKNLDKWGILSEQPDVNPIFANWTKAWVPYCDGSLHQGTRNHSISYKDKFLYFRGVNNTLETLRYLNETVQFFAADTIVVTGVSAGASATFLWSNYIYDQSLNKNVLSIPDSGVFINEFVNPFSGKKEMIENSQAMKKLINTEIGIPIPECQKDYPDLAECFSAGHLPKYLKNPFLLLESQYDLYDIGVALGLNCTPNVHPSTMDVCNDSEVAAIESYRQATLEVFNNFTSQRTDVGIWAPSCIQHGFIDEDAYSSDTYKVPSDSGPSIIDAITNFLANPVSDGNINIDSVAWPGNGGCSG
jgi:hypothetical protein